MDKKSEAARLGWRVVESREILRTPFIHLRQDRIQIADKGEVTYIYDERADAVGVVPVTADGMLLLISQYRYPIDAWCLEIPAGGMRDHADATPEEVARIELREETGATCDAMDYVGFFYVAAASRTQRFHVFLARGLHAPTATAHELTEHIELRPTPVAQALHLAHTGQMPESQSALSLLLCEPLLRKHGYLGTT